MLFYGKEQMQFILSKIKRGGVNHFLDNTVYRMGQNSQKNCNKSESLGRKVLSLCNKLLFSNLYIFATQCHRP